MAVEAFVGVSCFEAFSVDVVVGSVMTAEPQPMHPSTVIDFNGLVPPAYLLYPIVDHVADKVCATFERHGDKPSSRVRDLVDLVVIARTQTVTAAELRTAIETERLHRRLPPIAAFAVPPGWARRYSSQARLVAECRDHPALADAVEFVGGFLDPVLGEAQPTGTWSPRAGWT